MLIGKNRGKEGLLSLKQNKSVNFMIAGLKGIKYQAQLKRLKSMKYILLINVKITLQEMCCGFWLSREMWYRKSVLPGTGAG